MKKKAFLSILTLLIFVAFSNGQFTDSTFYDFRDGTIITAGQSTDGALTLSGNYSHHGTTYGLNMKVDGEIGISVTESSTLKFLGSKHSGLNMLGQTSNGDTLCIQDTKVVNDLADTYDFVYSGAAESLKFTTIPGSGNDLYLPEILVVPAQPGGDALLTAALKNIIYSFDLRDGSIIPNDPALNGNYTIEQGLFKIESGPSNAYGYNGDQHGSILKTGNIVTLQVAGNSYIKLGGCQYSNGTINVSSTTGNFDVNSKSSNTAECYHNDGTTIDFLYVGAEGEVVLTFDGTTYVPIIEILPVPYKVNLTPWVQKSGTISVNGVDISLSSGATSADPASVTLSEGTVISATNEIASIQINLGGNELGSYTPTFTGEIDAVAVSNDSLIITYSDASSEPNVYVIRIADNSTAVEAEAGKTYTYNLADGSELPQTDFNTLRYTTFVSGDGILTMNSNTETESLQFGYHDSSHGAVLFSGNSMDIIVAGNASLTFITCQYGSADDAVFEITDSEGTLLATIDADNVGVGASGTSSYSYEGSKGTLTATLKSEAHPTSEIYIHGLTVENAAEIVKTGKIDVWDFGAEQLDAEIYENNLTVDIINAWYDAAIVVGSTGNVLPSFSAGVLSWIGGSNDRLRSTNASLTRYDENIASSADYTGRVYVNSGANTGRFMSLTLSEDDEVTIIAKTDAGGRLNFEYVADPAAQTDVVAMTSDFVELNFVAKQAGTYHIFDDQGKPSYFRIYRKDASYASITGTADVSLAPDLPAGYAVLFENEAGKIWQASMTGNDFSIDLPVGYSYELSLSDANGYIITTGKTLEVTAESAIHDISLLKVELYNVSGAVTGLDSEIAKLGLVFTPDPSANKIFVPEVMLDTNASTYTVQLESGCEYTIEASGVNDFSLTNSSLTIGQADESVDLVFEAKPLYQVTIQAADLNAEQLAKLGLTFSNLNEEGYEYSFSSISDILLRDGVYTVSYSGLDEYPVALALTSNLKVTGGNTTKELNFEPVTVWSFDDKVIESGSTAYNGLIFTGSISNEIAKGHLSTKPDATIQVPVKVGDKLSVTFYYAADFSIEGGEAYTTSSGSTNTYEYADYVYTGTDAGYVTITIGSGTGTTYITEIKIGQLVSYAPIIYVGSEKEFKTINGALDAISKMVRENGERVSVMIDPGNYEEMLVINQPNVSFKNASTDPSISLLNKGVDIDANAVRITAYYGHGYDYFSMGNNQKWNADILEVNKENGYLSYHNTGSGTGNGSYWNASVVIAANGFEADHIIFENSFNQYISQKESEDVVVMWESGSKGARPVDVGNTDVQTRSFVERGAAIAITNNTDKVVLNKCRVIGRQDAFYGGSDTRVVIYKGAVMGAVDYLFGGMTAVFYKTDLVMNTSDESSDRSYLTAAQQSSGRGYLMYECNVKSTVPGIETASLYHAKPGYFGRPWQPTTSEVVFFNTTIETSDFAGFEGKSLISPEGWTNSLGGESSMMYEYGSIEISGEDNSANRASWSTLLSQPVLTDGTDITTFNFTKGTDNWDPIPDLIANDNNDRVPQIMKESEVNVYAYSQRIFVSNVSSDIQVDVYSVNGVLVKTINSKADVNFNMDKGFWIVRIVAEDGQKTVKVLTY